MWQAVDDDVVDAPASVSVRRYFLDTRRRIDGEAHPVKRPDFEAELVSLLRASEVAGELVGGRWREVRVTPRDHGAGGLSPTAEKVETEVVLAHIDATTAWQVLGHRRIYPIDGDHAREYLAFGRDPLARILADRFVELAGRVWPVWFDYRKFPRLLTAVMGERHTPQGLHTMAQRHLRAALGEAQHSRARLSEVFTPQVTQSELQAVREAGLASKMTSWRPEPDGSARTETLIYASGVAERLTPVRRDTVELRDPVTGLSREVPAEIVGLEYYDGAIVTIDGQPFKVSPDPGDPRVRLLTRAPAQLSTPIRELTCRWMEGSPVQTHHLRFGSSADLVVSTGRMLIAIAHRGVRCFDLDGRLVYEGRSDESKPGGRRSVRGSSGSEGALDDRETDEAATNGAAQPTSQLTTWARVITPHVRTTPVLHTMCHLLRDLLGYFYLKSSECLGVTYATDEELNGRGGVVVFDRHFEGLGFVSSIRPEEDLRAILTAAREVLRYNAAHRDNPATWSRSSRCTLDPPNCDLDPQETLAVLETLLTH